MRKRCPRIQFQSLESFLRRDLGCTDDHTLFQRWFSRLLDLVNMSWLRQEHRPGSFRNNTSHALPSGWVLSMPSGSWNNPGGIPKLPLTDPLIVVTTIATQSSTKSTCTTITVSSSAFRSTQASASVTAQSDITVTSSWFYGGTVWHSSEQVDYLPH